MWAGKASNFIFISLVAFTSACSSYPTKTKDGYDAFLRRDFTKAEAVYKEGSQQEGVDQLLYLFDHGMVNHTAGNYDQSIKDLLQADRLSEIKDYTNLSQEIASIITNDRIETYKGEEFENVLVSTYLAMNYALLGKDEDAIVECRRVNRKLERLRSEGQRDYNLNAFAQYLSGILFERKGDWNNAYVDYKKTFHLKPNFGPLRTDLLEGAVNMDSETERDRWRRSLGAKENEFRDAAYDLHKTGSIVVLFQNGLAPEKIESHAWAELPEYTKRYNKHKKAVIYLNEVKKGDTEQLYDIEDVAFKNLQQKYATYIAKRVAGFAVKEIVAQKVAEKTKSQALGDLTLLFMFMISRPDLRAWLTLPKDLQVARMHVVPGLYHVQLRLVNSSGQEEAPKELGAAEIKKPGDIVLLNYRSLND